MNNEIKSSHKILLLKEQYNVKDDDPIFLFLQGYSDLQDRLLEAIGGVSELERVIYQNDKTLINSTEIVNEQNKKLEQFAIELPAFVLDEMRSEISYIQEEIVKLGGVAEESIKSILDNADKYSSTIESLSNNTYLFKKSMKAIELKQPNQKVIYFLFTIIVLLQIASLIW